jgi:2-amino-4-hydroxy-6-hydroxymethyldihydropteridine diphosphokinase
VSCVVLENITAGMGADVVAYVGLGSNLEQPLQQVKDAITALKQSSEILVLQDSGYFTSKPMGPEDQPDYVNAVVKIKTTLSPILLLKKCQLIEQQQARIKTRHWGERTIDLDILLYADEKISEPDLTVPHPGICQRDFVYLPLLKIAADIEIPGKGQLNSIIKSTADNVADFSCQFAGNIE